MYGDGVAADTRGEFVMHVNDAADDAKNDESNDVGVVPGAGAQT
jgi:hypothetical protein